MSKFWKRSGRGQSTEDDPPEVVLPRLARKKVANVRKFFPELATTIGEATEKEAKAYDRFGAFAHNLQRYSDDVQADCPGIHQAFADLSAIITECEQYRLAYAQHLKTHIEINSLAKYTAKCKELEAEIHRFEKAVSDRKAKNKKLTKAEGATESIKQQTNLTTAGDKVGQASEKVNALMGVLVKKLHDFEREKIEDLKQMAKDLIQAKMWYFAKELETLSIAHKQIDTISIKDDMKDVDLLLRGINAQATAAASPGASKSKRHNSRPTTQASAGESSSDGGDSLSDHEDGFEHADLAGSVPGAEI